MNLKEKGKLKAKLKLLKIQELFSLEVKQEWDLLKDQLSS
jgi:hypothetical protein